MGNIDWMGVMFAIMCMALGLAFVGDSDLIDTIIHNLMGD